MGNTVTLLTIGGGFLAAVGVAVAVLAFRAPARTDADVAVERLDAYTQVEAPLNLDSQEANLPFRERVLLPIIRQLAATIGRRTPDASMRRLQRTLTLAGNPLGLSPGEFLAVRYVAAGLGSIAGALLGWAINGPTYAVIGAAVAALVAYIIPRFLISSRVKKAQKSIRRSLPDAMDLMSVCVEAGLTFEGAMGKVAERSNDRLGTEFGQVLSEIRLGRQRRDAMADLGDRSGVDEVNSFAQAVIQSDSLGTGIAKVLRIQSDELRRRRRQRAQEKGAQASLKMLFPMVLFIFPALWIVLLGPAVLLLLKGFSGK
jgi:tight adherence protein C